MAWGRLWKGKGVLGWAWTQGRVLVRELRCQESGPFFATGGDFLGDPLAQAVEGATGTRASERVERRWRTDGPLVVVW